MWCSFNVLLANKFHRDSRTRKKMILILLVAVLPVIFCQNLPGGPVAYKLELDDPIAVFAVQAINEEFKSNGDSKLRTAVQIIGATSQVVAGVIYKIQFEVTGGSVNEYCNVSVWSRPWLPEDEATLVQGHPKCIEKPSKRQLIGGETPIPLSDPEVVKALSYLESDVNANVDSATYLKAVSGTVTKQVVNGFIYRFTDVKFAESSCTETEVETNPDKVCQVNANTTPSVQCSAQVYWNPREVVEYQVQKESCASL